MNTLLSNILEMSKKKKGIAAAIIILSFVILSGMLVSCNSSDTTPSSPIEVVKQHLMAKKNNDVKALNATLTEDYKFSENTILGVIQLEIIEVKDETDPRYMEEALKGQVAKENGWSSDNLTFVSATYDVLYDNELVPEINGRKKWVFKLVRLDANSPWLIRDWGDARFE